METERLTTLEEVRLFIAGSAAVDFAGADRESTYEFTRRTLSRFEYGRLGRSDKGLLRRYLTKATGLSRAQVARLIRQHADTGRIEDRRGGAPSRPFERRYTAPDVRLLAEVDEILGQLSGPATRAVMRREHDVFGDARFERLARLSNGHLYNLRKSRTYRRKRTAWTRTKPSAVAIGERRKPQPDGRPGFVRVDSVHQGDLDGRKGIYEINLVDEVTQYEFVGAVEAISERFLIPVLEGLLARFPFVIKGFHADNGSEYVNHRVAALLEKLRAEFTRSRPRRSNDNALVESKNGSVVRRHLGHAHIPARFAPLVLLPRALPVVVYTGGPALAPGDPRRTDRADAGGLGRLAGAVRVSAPVDSNTEMSLNGATPVVDVLGSCRCERRMVARSVRTVKFVRLARAALVRARRSGVLAPLRERVSKAGCRLR